MGNRDLREQGTEGTGTMGNKDQKEHGPWGTRTRGTRDREKLEITGTEKYNYKITLKDLEKQKLVASIKMQFTPANLTHSASMITRKCSWRTSTIK